MPSLLANTSESDRVLDILAPVSNTVEPQTASLTQLGATIARHQPVALARMQADRLDPLWPVAADYLNSGMSSAADKYKFAAGDLKTMFVRSAHVFQAAQMQTPAILPQQSDEWLAQKLSYYNQGNIQFRTVLSGYNDESHLNHSARYSFGFISVVDAGDIVQKLYSIPYIGLDEWMIDAFVILGGQSALFALQRNVSWLNHDWLHLLQPYNLRPYFKDCGRDKAQLPRGLKEFYAMSPLSDRWSKLMKDREGMEYNPLVTHANIFQRMWDEDGNFRQSFTQDMDIYLTGVQHLANRIDQIPEMQKKYDITGEVFASAAATLLGVFLLRAVPAKDNVMDAFVGLVNDRISVSAAHIENMCAMVKYRDLPCEPEKSGERIRAHARHVANQSFGVIHHENFMKHYGVSRRLIVESLQNIREGLKKHAAHVVV